MTSNNSLKYFVKNWHTSDDFMEIIKQIYLENDKSLTLRHKFDFLELPMLNEMTDLIQFKIAVVGNKNVGKSAFINRLCGQNNQNNFPSFPGLTVHKIYFPLQLINDRKRILIDIDLWDCNSRLLESDDCIAKKMMENVDGIIFVFSMADKSSFQDLGGLISRTMDKTDKNSICQFVVGTKVDLHLDIEVPRIEVKQFEDIFNIPVFFVSNVLLGFELECRHGREDHPPFCQELDFLMPLLQRVADDLWHRDIILNFK